MARLRTEVECVELPEEIIRYIQSFLLYKEAAQTSMVAKSWFNAWCTRSTIFINTYDFNEAVGFSFWEYVTRTVQRCVDLNVKVDQLTLLLPRVYEASVVDKLVVDILKLRVNELKLIFPNSGEFYVVPSQVFENKYLTELHLTCCKIDNLDSRNVLCSNLRKIYFFNVAIQDSTFKDILIRNPTIESLTLSGNMKTGLTRINACDLGNLKTLTVSGLELESPSITPSVICGRFVNLSCMVLSDVRVGDSFFTNFSSSFPKLEDLTLEEFNHDVNIQLSSNSIKRLSLEHSYEYEMVNMAKLDVPNIREFKYAGELVPPISFTASSDDWRSDIELSKYNDILDLSQLRELRRKLRRSKISLHLKVYHDSVDAPERNFDDLYLPVLEDLWYNPMHSHNMHNFFTECILSCRPKLVNFFRTSVALAIPLLYQNFIEQKKNDLLEVSVEFEDSMKQWQPLTSLSDALEIWNYRVEQLRLKLEWESLTPTIIKFIED